MILYSMKLLKHRSKILKHNARIMSHKIMGGSINHLQQSHGGNVSALKQQLRHMVIGKAKKPHRVKF